MSDDKFKGFHPKPYKVPNLNDIMKQSNERAQELSDAMAKTNAEKYRYDQEVLRTLKNIETNTVGLNEIIPLLSENLENQEEMLEFLKESLSISASASKEEAEGKWRALMKRAGEITKDVETIQKLHGFANTVLQMFINSGI